MAIPFISAIKSAYILTGGSYVMQFQKAVRPLRGEISVPGDKSISHRAVMFGAISEGTTEVTNFLQGADCLSTISCFRSMGIEIENTPERILVHGKGLHGLSAPSAVLDCGNSGTTARLISGILAGQNFSSTLTGDASIQKRPMGRIINPLTQMGASIRSIPENGCAPLAINGHPLHAISYLSPVASAQVKSCVLLAGLYADGKTSVTEPALSRNHTELMLKFFGADVASEGLTASVLPDPDLHGNLVRVPGDISSAAYFIAAALMVPGSEVLLKNVGINPTRDGMLRVCRAMGADITLLNEQNSGGEPVADLLVRYTPSLSGTVIEGELIPTLIDEIPIIAVLAGMLLPALGMAKEKAKLANCVGNVKMNLQTLAMYTMDYNDWHLGGEVYCNPGLTGDDAVYAHGFLAFLIRGGYVKAVDQRNKAPWTYLLPKSWGCTKTSDTRYYNGMVRSWFSYGLVGDFPEDRDLAAQTDVAFFKTNTRRFSSPSRILYMSDAWAAGTKCPVPVFDWRRNPKRNYGIALNHQKNMAPMGFLDGHSEGLKSNILKNEYQCNAVLVPVPKF